MKKKFVVVVSVLLIAVVGLCGCTANNAPTDGAVPSIVERVSSLEQRATELEARPTGGDVSDIASDVQILSVELTTMQSRLNDLSTRLAALEGTGGNGVIPDETTRWSWRKCQVYSLADVSEVQVVVYDTDPRRIEEEGLYDVSILLENQGNSTVNLVDAEIELVLEPRDYCMIDEDNTYLDSDSAPWLWWETDFVIKVREGRDVCKSIAFISDKYSFGELGPHEWIELELILELYYL